MKVNRGNFPKYGGVRKGTRPKHRLGFVRQLNIVLGSLLVTVSTLGLIGTINGDSRMNNPSKNIEASAYEPQGAAEVLSSSDESKKDAKNAETAIGSDSQTTIATSIPPKPAWVNKPLYVEPDTAPLRQAQAVAGTPEARYFARMGSAPVAHWFGEWEPNVTASVGSYVAAANAQGAVPVVVLYAIPNRDCGSYSAGGLATYDGYVQWIRQVVAGIGGRQAVVVLEPDALPGADCLSAGDQKAQQNAIGQAVTLLKASSNTTVYIDAGNPTWKSASTMAARLNGANIAAADGFSLNISYYSSVEENVKYGESLARLVGNKHYVIDSSRSGAGRLFSGAHCNPSFAAMGQTPTTNTGSALNDGLLWIKIPWESDGACDGSPAAGSPYWSYAALLARNAGW